MASAGTALRFVEMISAVRPANELGSTLPLHLPPDALNTLVQRAVELSPTSFNSQSTRVLILHGHLHRQFWERLTTVAISSSPDRDALAAQVMSAACTVVLCDDVDAIAQLQTSYPKYASMLPGHAEQGSAMAELAVVSALGYEGVSTVARHYRASLRKLFSDLFQVPPSWEMKAQMACGVCTKAAIERGMLPDEYCFKVLRS